ncbi:FAD dependent oxidoreductase [Cordyceps militaris CM01]|uniref:FAD dependent oxidoreductase n=1 Tax=Cordyceps militaris (strain CM01) TaxID=983644 RepID=G3JEA0_CORMM|nr:FAD dependent oxidoreductase [Cordyceps militaris CM01]EGX92925.1 FAD dependent oxidoreductase [Cordyceps militaris CM01]
MATPISTNLMEELYAQALADPQLPRDNPTTAFWQLPPHPSMSETRSAELPTTTDYAIIGSGVTGCSMAKTLLDSTPSATSSVTVFEARKLTSGATGRNGGLLTNFVPGHFKHLIDQLGHEQAIKIARFANRTLEKMHSLANSSDEFRDASVVRRTLDVIAFDDHQSFNDEKEGFKLYEKYVTEEAGKTQILTAEELAAYNVKANSGAILFPNGAFWPYRLITRLWAQLQKQHAPRLSIETNTPVTEIAYDPSNATHPYVLKTPRGSVRASKILHATNGYSGHLLPGLRGKIYPLRGTMSTQKPPAAFGNHGNAITWSRVGGGGFDPTTNVIELGLYYSNQNPQSGDVFIGENIRTKLPRCFTKGWEETSEHEVRKVWSGIMGFTGDRLPLIGKLPASATKRRGDGGEWIAAGFNGYGMPLCWSSGEAVAKMILGQDVDDFLPKSFVVTEERLEAESMSFATAINGLLSGYV